MQRKKERQMRRFLVFFAAGLLMLAPAAGSGAETGQEPGGDRLPKGHPAPEAPQGMVSAAGKVVEVLNSGGYTFVCLEKDGVKTWVAVPEMKVAVGEDISFKPGQEMPGFESKGLKRRFDSIVFSEGPLTPEGPAKGSAEKMAPVSGKVVQTMNGGGYTYLCLEKEGEKVWVAVPEMKASVGQTLTLRPGMEMVDFKSKALGRTFERIVFSDGPVAAEEKAPHKTGGSKGAVTAATEKIKVDKASGPNAYTVAELYRNKARLDGKRVVVSGKVVKVSAGIMDRNWIHLRDGSGTPKKGNHNLVVTSQDLPLVGDVVTASGTLRKDKDFGGGYRYEVILEKATIQP